jgi:hypothetical protein
LNEVTADEEFDGGGRDQGYCGKLGMCLAPGAKKIPNTAKQS